MTQETIGSKGTVPGYRPLIGAERWHRDDFTAEMLDGGWRPLLLGERAEYATDKLWESGLPVSICYHGPRDGTSKLTITKRHLPPPAVETFETHSHIWYKHTPGDECPVEPDVVVDVLLVYEMEAGHMSVNELAIDCQWDNSESKCSIIGYRFPDYPAVHTTLQQEQLPVQHVEKTEQSFQHCDQLKQQLTSIYNGWVHLPPETVAECIADVASVLYPTDAERCEAAFQRWWNEVSGPEMNQGLASEAWNAAWFEAKKSK